jgi:hypothetical protein
MLPFDTFRRQLAMAKTSSISIRLEPEQLEDVHRLAVKFGTNDIQIVRWAIDALRDYVALHQGKLHMPIDFEEFWKVAEKKVPAKKPKRNANCA